ncbi:MAG: hypothetical protein ACRDUT_00085 [Mycobacterium sp.]
MAEKYAYSNVKLHVRHEPEQHPSEGDLPGHYVLGAEFGGAFHPIARLKGGGVEKRVKAAKSGGKSSGADDSEE